MCAVLQAVQRQINQKRDECEQRIIACKGRESLLEEKQFKIQEAIKRFDKFIQENDVKRSRAAKKERDERLERVAKEAEAEEHKTKLKGLQVLATTISNDAHQWDPRSPLWVLPQGTEPSEAAADYTD